MSRVKTRPGLRASVSRISNSTKVVATGSPREPHGALVGVDPQLVVLERAAVAARPRASSSERRSAAFTRLRNSRIENGLVM